MMGWQDLLTNSNETFTFPWVGGRSIRRGEQVWQLEGKLPPEHGWSLMDCRSNRKAKYTGAGTSSLDVLKHVVRGYLVGNRLVADDARVDPDPMKIAEQAEEVFLVDPGIERFVRISAGRFFEGGPLIFCQQEFPLGPEAGVYDAFLEEETDLSFLREVSPALDAAFKMESWQRLEARKRRLEAEKRRREEQERLAKEQRRRELVERLGDGAGRRAMAMEDFGEAARAALAVGGATYLDHRKAARKHEVVVQFRLLDRRFECTCDDRTLQVIDAGICLVAHHGDSDFKAGTKGDTFFTLESLPGVIAEAEKLRKLVIFRHVDGDDADDMDD